MAELAKLIRVEKKDGVYTVEINGQNFPWYLTEDGVTAHGGNRTELTTVTLTIPCERVELVDTPWIPDER